jgi:SPP1 family phage portal protein
LNPKSGWEWRKHFLPRGFSQEQLLDAVRYFISKQYQYNVLHDYYVGKQDILNRSMNDASKPNNRIVNNFAKLIVDTNASYFLGKPITYVCEDPNTLETVEEFLMDNDARDIDAELAKMASTYGHGFELHWINSDGKHQFKYRHPKHVLAIYSLDLEEELLCAVNISSHKDYMTNARQYFIEIYDKESITTMKGFVEGEEASWEMIDVKQHPFGEVPVIEYVANDERQGDFEMVMSQIDAYDQVVSDSVNDIEYFNDAYLLLRDLNATTIEDIQQMKENRVLMVDGSGDAQFLTKNVHDKHIENIKDRLVMDIHKHAQTPNLSDEQFATNLSGTAIRYKMLSLENRTSMRERKFTQGIMKRIRLVARTEGLKGNDIDDVVHPVFVRNLPANMVEIADMAIKLKDIVSDETLRSQIPFVLDLDREKELVDEQKQQDAEMQMQMKMFPAPDSNKSSESGMNTHNLQLKGGDSGGDE